MLQESQEPLIDAEAALEMEHQKMLSPQVTDTKTPLEAAYNATFKITDAELFPKSKVVEEEGKVISGNTPKKEEGQGNKVHPVEIE